MSLNPEESLAQIESDVRRSEERAAKLPAFEAAVAKVRGSAASQNRDIQVQVDSTGRVVGLRLGDQALARGSQRLAHDLLAVIRAAEDDARATTLRAVGELLGDDDPITAQLRDAGTTPASR